MNKIIFNSGLRVFSTIGRRGGEDRNSLFCTENLFPKKKILEVF